VVGELVNQDASDVLSEREREREKQRERERESARKRGLVD